MTNAGPESKRTLDREREAERVIHTHVPWAMAAGLMPIPWFDIAAVTAVQMDLLKQLAYVYGVDYSSDAGKRFASSLTGSTFAWFGASFIKAVPVVGTVMGGLSMSVMAGASTYAVGSVARTYFASGVRLRDVDTEEAKHMYDERFEKGKDVASDLESKIRSQSSAYKAAFEAVEKLRELKDQDLVTEEEFEELKRKLLNRL